MKTKIDKSENKIYCCKIDYPVFDEYEEERQDADYCQIRFLNAGKKIEKEIFDKNGNTIVTIIDDMSSFDENEKIEIEENCFKIIDFENGKEYQI